MNYQDKEERQDFLRPEKKSSWRRRFFKRLFYFVLAVVATWGIAFLLFDRQAKEVLVADVYQEVDADKGEVPDYHALFNALQERDVFPIDENGWLSILRTFGPRAFDQERMCARTKWEDYASNEATATWRQDYWIPICEKFKLDPNEKPIFYDSMDLRSYLVKNGVRGGEETPEDAASNDGNSIYSYWENGVEGVGKINFGTADKEIERISARPWLTEDSPIAAKWFEENVEQLAVLADAARRPKFQCWRVIEPEGNMIAMLVRDQPFTRQIIRLFKIRANLRVASGDIAGALDDMETLVALERHLLDNESSLEYDRFLGLSALKAALSVPLYANAKRRPTSEERARVYALWREELNGEKLDERVDFMRRNEALFACGVFADALKQLGNGDATPLALTDDVSWINSQACNAFFKLLPINEPQTNRYFRDRYFQIMNAETEAERVELMDELKQKSDWRNGNIPKTFAARALLSLCPTLYYMQNSYENVECCLKLNIIAQGIWAYYDANGTLPPAFSVDANGVPLHSWRVLILPYLGEKENALCEQIRIDEPWNSDYNRAFYKQMPDVYRCPSMQNAQPGETIYSLLLAQDGFFDRSGIGKDPMPFLQRSDRDAVAQIMIAESPTPYGWMCPDVEIDLDSALVLDENGTIDREKYAKVNDIFGFKAHSDSGCNSVTFGGARVFLSYMDPVVEAKFLHETLGIPEPNQDQSESDNVDAMKEDDSADTDATRETPMLVEENSNNVESSSGPAVNSNATLSEDANESDATSNEETPNPELD